ncbi:MAG: HAMP domain-containing histidine kinase, partial [Chloroflexota bacterium]|nr:HAMP domain-containing histidine kinase [Chloroflexota bacterium]
QLEEFREDVMATTVHDLQQPITTLKARLQLALRHLGSGAQDVDRFAGMLNQAVAETDRLAAMLLTVTEASRVALGRLDLHRASADLGTLLPVVVGRLDPDTAARVHVTVVPGFDAAGEWDAPLLERVLVNLLSNAAKYSPANTSIEVGLTELDRAVHLTVRDSGIGLAHEEHVDLFRRYGRTQSATRSGIAGLGLGLYLSRGIVDAHGGRIWAESAGPGQGTAFHVVLPRHPEPGFAPQ